MAGGAGSTEESPITTLVSDDKVMPLRTARLDKADIDAIIKAAAAMPDTRPGTFFNTTEERRQLLRALELSSLRKEVKAEDYTALDEDTKAQSKLTLTGNLAALIQNPYFAKFWIALCVTNGLKQSAEAKLAAAAAAQPADTQVKLASAKNEFKALEQNLVLSKRREAIHLAQITTLTDAITKMRESYLLLNTEKITLEVEIAELRVRIARLETRLSAAPEAAVAPPRTPPIPDELQQILLMNEDDEASADEGASSSSLGSLVREDTGASTPFWLDEFKPVAAATTTSARPTRDEWDDIALS